MNHTSQILFGVAAVVLSFGYFIRSIQPAEAFPQGPNVSMGSNPIVAFSSNCSQSSPSITTTGSDTLIITDIIVGDGSYTEGATLKLNGSDWMSFPETTTQSFNSGFPVPPSSTLSCYAYYGKTLVVSGYYTHP